VGPFTFSPAPKGLRSILIATCATWLIQLIPGAGSALTDVLALVPQEAIEHLQLWRFITYVFLHDPHSPMHILFNMLALWMFGTELEEQWGVKRFVGFYFLSAAGSGLFSLLLWHSHIIGASGAVLALLTVYACYFPDRTMLMFFIIPMPVRMAVVIIGVVSLWGAWSGTGDIAYLTHLGGIAVGFLYFKYYSSVIAWGKRREGHLEKGTILQFKPKKGTSGTQRYFENVIDPILKKISEKGMSSLTKDELKKLEDASKKPPAPGR
jgi:membrane associated rhomboid family serine protease